MSKPLKNRTALRRVAMLGSMDGPLDGQRKLTKLFAQGTRFETILHEFNGHRGVTGGARILFEALRAFYFSLIRRPDVVYLAISRSRFGAIRDLIIVLPYLLARIPVVAHVHGADFERYYDRARRLSVSWLQLRAVNRFIFIHETYKFSRANMTAGAIIRNPLPNFPEGRLPKGHRGTFPSFGFISSFVPRKGLETFLEVAQDLTDQGRWVVAGGANSGFPIYGKKLAAIVTDTPYIDYLGYLDEPLIFFEQVDFFIFPTTYQSEAVPGVVVEALLAGCIPLVRRNKRLERVFEGAPIQWFDDLQDLKDLVTRCAEMRPSERSAVASACQFWVRRNFPSISEWVNQVDEFLLENGVTLLMFRADVRRGGT